MKKIFTRLFAVLLLSLVCTSAWAQFENGKVYRIVCSGTTTVSLGASALTDVAAVSTSETEKTQQWYVTVSGSNYTFRNLANGRYLQGNNATSNAWGLTEESNNFTVTAVNGNYAIRGASHSNGYGYMHKDGSNNIVSWESGAANSQWTPIEVSYTAEELQAVWDEVESLVVPSTTVDTYEGYLDVLFSDKSCVTPKLATLDAAKATEAYNNLPVTLQEMVDKVYGGDWTESTVAPADRPNGNNNTNHSLWTVANTWDNDYAKKFRVQMYEPYSVEGEITSYLRINAHCNMDNPTGIYANAGEPMYIMVEGTIAEGAELWVAHQVGHGATNYYNNAAYTQLHEGLNVVPYFADGSQLWINYLVHTYNDSEKTIAEKFPHKLSEYKPLKIHIEGGKINGFFNAMGDYRATTDAENLWGEVDNDADWNYYKARAALSGDFALLGHRQTLLFDFGTYSSTKGHFGVANADGGIEYALPYHLENITVPATPNCYAGSGKAFGNYSDTYYPGMNLVTENGTPNKVNIMLEAWDRIQYSEHASLGLLSVANMEKMNALYPRWTTAGEAAEIYNYGEATINNVTQTYQQFCQGIDYSEYYNHHGAAVGAGSGYMSGGWRVCNYHYNTMGSIIGKIADEAGPTWGPAHEIGHQHQNIFNLNGQTEVTNNFHANVAVWYMGMGTSRYNGDEGNLEHVLGAYNTDGNDLYTNNIWALTHLYYRLWLYYHLAGNNTQFWPRLFELLRQVPIVNGGQISGETSLLRFYQHACDAAGEDLTEFFRAHGFFEIMTDRLVGDYSNGTYNVTEEQIETAISAVKAKNYPVNYAVLLINDGTSETTLKHDGESKRALWDNNPSAEYGSVTDFIEGNTSVTTAYEATVSADGTVTMSGGTGGVGFLILNEKGEIVSFSNKASFEISDEAAYLLATGKAEIVAVDSKNNTEEAEVDLSAVQSSLIVTLVADVENLLKYVDDTYTKVGYYKASSVVDLQSALNTAKATIETGTGLAAAYELLYAEYQKVLNDENARVAIISGAKYAIKSKSGNDYMDVDDSGNVKTTASSTFPTDDSDLWIIEIASKDTYNIKNANTGKYLQEVSDANGVNFTVGDNAVNYGITNVDYVYHAFSTKKYSGRYMDRHSATQVATWGGIGENAKWFITLADNDLAEEASAIAELQALIAKAESLVNEVATVSLKGELQLQANNEGAAFYITSNATETGHEPKYLLDNNVSTFFHTVWWGTSPGADHYLQIDLGEEYPIDQFVFEYTNLPTTSNNVDAAEAITVQVANALDNFTTIANLTTSDSNPLPTAKGGTYTSATLGTKDASYRYIRLIVTDATGGMLSNHYYFGMSEFSLERLNSYSKVKDAYTGHITQDVVATVADKLADAKTAITNGDDIAAAKSNLQTAYDALKAAYDAVLDAKRTELQALIESTTTLINGTATVTPETKEKVTLTTTAGSAGYLYCNAQINEGSLGNLLVDDNSFMHTHWGSTTSADHDYHYLRVDMGEGNTIGEFSFTYTTASRAKRDMPAEIVVEGANEIDSDNSTLDTFTLIDTLTSLPEVLNTYSPYTSTILGDANTPYRYLRFKVTKNNCGELDGDGHPFFTMTRFGLTKITPATATVKDTYLDTKATPELVLATYDENSNAATMKNIATSMAMLQTQIDKLQAAYNALETARETSATFDKTALEELINNTKELLGRIAENSTSNAEIALQVGDADSEYYLWSNAPANDCNDYSIKVQGLIDENNDGSANTGTFFGTDWGSHVDAYTHYIEIDMGVNTVLEDLSIDYTTRDSGHTDSRPNGLKFFGSNNKVDYEEFHSVTTGLPADANTKWTMPAPIELTKNYRYVRIAVSSPHGSCFNMADFNLYTNIDYSLKEYYTTATDLDFVELCLALQSAEDLLTRDYITTAQYDAVYEKLNSCYTAANNVVNADFDDRSALTELIALTETLIGDVATVTEVVAPVLSTSNLYCNADNSTNGSAGENDKRGVAALLDGNLATHLHTTYGGNAQDDDLDHYIRVDMGEDKSVSAFEFSYTGRSTNSNNDPSTMVIQGCNTLDGEWDEIKTLTGLPTEGDKVQYHSGMIEASVAYRYIRFMVTETQNNSKTTYNNIDHPFFVMSEFSFATYPTVEVAEGFTNVTTALVRAAYNEMNTAIAENAHYISESDYNAALAALQADYDALNLAKNLGDIPVILTTDVNNPVLYKIQIKSNENVFTYEGETADASKKPVLAASELGNRYQAWYFMQGTNSESYEDILILPYFNEGEKNTTLRLSYANNNDGTDPAVVASGTNTTDNWYITFTSEGNNVTTEGWWNLQPEGGSDVNAYVNQWGGGDATRLAFWRNASNPSNNSSQFRFVLDETDYSLSDAYYALYNKYTELGGKLTAGTAIGDYTEASATEYNDAYNTAGTLLEAKASTDDEYTAARETLENEYAAIEYVMPEEGKFYLIRSISTEAYCNGKYVHALCDKRPTNANQNHKHLVFDALGDIAQYPLAVFVFEDINANGECKMKNLHTGMYVKSFTKNAEHMTTDYESAATVKIGNFAPGQAILRIGDTAPMHAQNANSVIVHWEAAAGNASLWSIDEVTDLSQIVHNVTMNATFSSVTLGYNATAPAGVRVYNAKGIDSGYVTLEKIADGDEANNVIPANTPVILYRADDVKTKTFSYTEATAAKPSESLLGGSLYTKYVECDDSDYYKLMIKNGEAKMYLMYKEFDANGNSLGETHDGGHIKCTANKIFMRVPGLSQAAVYSMRFINPETTDIDGVNAENGEEKTIYDLQGRKLTEITAPGIYIVNGKKVLVK